MDLNKRLREHTGLTPTDQCLRDYFLRYPERAARMNTRQLAEATFTSPSAVTVFFRVLKAHDFQGVVCVELDYQKVCHYESAQYSRNYLKDVIGI